MVGRPVMNDSVRERTQNSESIHHEKMTVLLVNFYECFVDNRINNQTFIKLFTPLDEAFKNDALQF